VIGYSLQDVPPPSAATLLTLNALSSYRQLWLKQQRALKRMSEKRYIPERMCLFFFIE
jgi:hypothetical protein